MRKVFKVTGLSAKVADCLGAKVIPPVRNYRGDVATNKKPALTVGKNRVKLVLDSIDLFVLNNAAAFKSPVSAHRTSLSHHMTSAVHCR